MSQSLAQILIHLVFSARDREACLEEHIHGRLQAYLVGILRHLACPPHAATIQPDHVHLVFELARTRSIAKVVEELKTGSSKWLKQQDPALTEFSWQDGYVVFSVSESRLRSLMLRLAAQRRYHAVSNYQDELRMLLAAHDMRFDERYLWS
ncbi:MAG: IS200/IS605 family transposase [Candidatus Delongbacteria bacterium]